MKNTNTPLKFSLKQCFFSLFKELEEVISYIISMIWAGIASLVIFGIPVIVLVIFLKIVSTIL